MSIEPICDHCGYADKSRCKTEEEAAVCPRTPKLGPETPKLGDDFGFSFVDETAVKLKASNNSKAQKLYSLVEPFLDNLAANPEKDIHWPNRDKKIGEFKKKLKKILDSEDDV